MSEINPVGRPELNGVQNNKPAQHSRAPQSQSPPSQSQDQVQLSNHARLLSKLRENPIREDLVARVRDQIDQGTYETPEKVDQAIDELRADLD